ncbi:MAG: pyridoxal phosphate-dependent aminotransferase [bacterium]
MSISVKVKSAMSQASWIRKMFEEGARLKAQYGADKVFDFSLGNPNLPPPKAFSEALRSTVAGLGPCDHGYMPNTGYPQTRKAVADTVSREQEASLSANEVIMTCGAAGALNVVFKTLFDPGDEVITPTPYFVEYGAYVDNHGGVLKTVPSGRDFALDPAAIAAAITSRTKAVLINSPNNPTGQVYTESALSELAAVMETASRRLNRTIYLIADEPYRKIVYDGAKVPSIFRLYRESIVVSSYSKDISIPGERLGFLAVHPQASARDDLLAGMAMTNRTLGYVNAPALIQRVIAGVQGACVDVGAYARKRDLLCNGLAEAGYEFFRPGGAFYLFPKSPDPDEVAFVRLLQEERILVVPGRGFGAPGYFRIAYCVSDETIINALPGFRRAMAKFKA